MSAPGVKFQFVDLNRPPIARLRTDICGFALFAERGPIDRAVKVTSWRQFLDTFGPPLDFAHGGQAVRLFFENGAAAAQVIRVTDAQTAAVASVALDPDGAPGSDITLRAAFSGIDKTEARAPGPLAQPGVAVSDNPGAWGNRLAVTVQPGGLGVTTSQPNQPADGASIRVEAIAGFHPGSHVRLLQDGQPHDRLARVAAIDPILREITWDAPVTGPVLDYSQPVRLETVEFTLVLTLDGGEIGRYENLSLEPEHPRYMPRALEAEAYVLAGTVTLGAADLTDPQRWPQPGAPRAFAGGANGLASSGKAQFLAALEVLERIDEVSVLCAPDLVLQADAEGDAPEPPLSGDLCHIPAALPRGQVRGQVVAAGSGLPVAGVQITSPEAATRSAVSQVDGSFLLDGLPVGQATLSFGKTGFVAREVTAQTFEFAPPEPQVFELAARTLPVPLTEDAIFEVQQAMILQCMRTRDRVALLDPPANRLRIEDIQSWRNRFDSSYAALYWPWLRVVPQGETLAREMPPSGAVAGLLARMDLAEGPQRAPANRTLRGVQARTDAVDDAVHAMLNEQGINVLRARPGRGVAPMGARTLSSEAEWRYLGVRRLMLMIAEAIEEGHQWAVFEPNTQILRDAIRHSLSAFLGGLWRRGALAGAGPEAAFALKCDAENNPEQVVNEGQLICDIAVAPVRPYEFIRLRLGRTDRLTVQVQE
ncbi:phage tail sheath C-terminal domain-containing protein [Thalassococcus sp. BH17M4-6]|uniref:phage tail sheath C-terminal domain-containing protein n=1 Tax=Thalassococcus sp. BH17M4-6 TaxID=3413148 RepID=UPI003BC5169C